MGTSTSLFGLFGWKNAAAKARGRKGKRIGNRRLCIEGLERREVFSAGISATLASAGVAVLPDPASAIIQTAVAANRITEPPDFPNSPAAARQFQLRGGAAEITGAISPRGDVDWLKFTAVGNKMAGQIQWQGHNGAAARIYDGNTWQLVAVLNGGPLKTFAVVPGRTYYVQITAQWAGTTCPQYTLSLLTTSTRATVDSVMTAVPGVPVGGAGVVDRLFSQDVSASLATAVGTPVAPSVQTTQAAAVQTPRAWADNVWATKADIRWTPAGGNVIGYEIETSRNGKRWETPTYAIEGCADRFTNLSPNTDYYVRIRPIFAGGRVGNFSNVVHFKTRIA